jgi:hypothetical protein
MKRALLMCAFVACATKTIAPDAQLPVSASFAVPKPTHWTLPFKPYKELLLGDGSVLMVDKTQRGIVIQELDPVSLAITRSVPIAFAGEFALWVRSHDRVYVLLDGSDTHRLIALDPASLTILAESITTDRVGAGTDHAYPPRIEPGKNGVRVSYRKPCAEDTAMGCVINETHALGDLKPTKLRHQGFSRGMSTKLPPLDVPRDQGEDDSLQQPKSDWSFGPDHQHVVSTSGQSVDCPVEGTLVGTEVWVGHRMFVVSTGCCGGPKGGFLICEVPE